MLTKIILYNIIIIQLKRKRRLCMNDSRTRNKFNGHCAFCGMMLNVDEFDIVTVVFEGEKCKLPICVECSDDFSVFLEKEDPINSFKEHLLEERGRLSNSTLARVGLIKIPTLDLEIPFFFEKWLKVDDINHS